MPESAAEHDSLQGGQQTLLPPPLPPRALDESEPAVIIPELQEPSEFAEDDAEPGAKIGHIAAALTSLGSMSFVSSALFHLVAWISALILLPLFGFDWLELIQTPQEPIVASLGDEDIVDELPRFEMVGSVDVEVEKPQSSVQQLSQHLQQSDSAWLQSMNDDLVNASSTDSDGEGDDGGGILLKIPEQGFAVTKGSFTAFTIPATPAPMKPYRIVIEVRLPGDVSKYRVSDLKGEVIGTDGYKQLLPYDKNTPSASRAPAANGKETVINSSSSIDVINNRVQIIIVVPGARNLVKDRIKIRSKRLREDQELTLTFGRPQTPENDEPEKP